MLKKYTIFSRGLFVVDSFLFDELQFICLPKKNLSIYTFMHFSATN